MPALSPRAYFVLGDWIVIPSGGPGRSSSTASMKSGPAHLMHVRRLMRSVSVWTHLGDRVSVCHVERQVRDQSWLPYMNELALDAFLHNCDRGVECDVTGELREVLVDLRAGTLPDPGRKMLGTLLKHLYPHDLRPSEIWNYLDEADKSPPPLGAYSRFWRTSLLEMSSDTQVAELLDTLSVRFDALRMALESYGLCDFPVELLARGLEVMGDERNTEQLCDWLSVGIRRGQPVFSRVRQATARIRTWLENRPEVQKAVIAEALRRWAEFDGSKSGRLRVEQYLHGARPPADFGHWCLERSVAAAQRGECTTTRYLLERAVEAVEYPTTGCHSMSWKSVLEAWKTSRPCFRTCWSVRLTTTTSPIATK